MDNPPPFKLSEFCDPFEHFDLKCLGGTLPVDVEQQEDRAKITIYNNDPIRSSYVIYAKLYPSPEECRFESLKDMSSFLSQTENIKLLDITSDTNSPFIVKYQKLKP